MVRMFGLVVVAAASLSKGAIAQVAVMGDPSTGALVAKTGPNAAKLASEAAKKKRPSGDWQVLLKSASPGYGAASCVRDQGKVHFFVAHGKRSGTEAAKAAQALAQPHAIKARTACTRSAS